MRKLIDLWIGCFLIAGMSGCTQHPSSQETTASTPAMNHGKMAVGKSSSSKTVVAHAAKSQSWAAPDFNDPHVKNAGSCAAGEVAAFDYRHLQGCIDSLLKAGQLDSAVVLLEKQITPHNNLDEIGFRTLQLAYILHSQGRDKEATDVLESLLAFKPVIASWMDSADAMERGMHQAANVQLQDVAPLVKQIGNLMAIKSEYGLIHELTDSLRMQPIPDSLRRWSLTQDSLALKRSFAKYHLQLDDARRQVLEAAQYEAARNVVQSLRVLGPEAAKTLQLDSMQTWVNSVEASDAKDRDPAYWKTHDPASALKDAQHLRALGKQEDALALLRKILQTPLRKDARANLNDLGEDYCTKQRQIAADDYSKSRKLKQPEPSKKLLEQAVAALDRCVVQFPESPQRPKVLQNRDLLEQEISKSKGTP